MRGRPPKQFCLRGHDTFAVGRCSNGRCRQCHREQDRGHVTPDSAQLSFWPLTLKLMVANTPVRDLPPSVQQAYQRGRRCGALTVDSADQLATAYGYHPSEVWDEWWTVA